MIVIGDYMFHSMAIGNICDKVLVDIVLCGVCEVLLTEAHGDVVIVGKQSTGCNDNTKG